MKPVEVLQKILASRKSTFPRDYSSDPIPAEIIDEIVESTEYTPNHKRTRPWRFKVFRGEEKLALGEELQSTYKRITPPNLFLEKKYNDIAVKIKQTDTVVSIVVNFSGLVPEWEEIAATSMAVQNMYLMCAAHKVGCYWSSQPLVNEVIENIPLEDNQRCLGLFYIGSIKGE